MKIFYQGIAEVLRGLYTVDSDSDDDFEFDE